MGKKKTPACERFGGAAGFNQNRTLGPHKKLPSAPPVMKQEVFYFHEADADSNIVLSEVNGKQQIKAGTLEKLVQRLTHETHLDPLFNETFLLTYRTFTSPNQLLNIVKNRYHMKPPSTAGAEWAEKAQKPIRLRVYNALKNWLLKGFYDFEDNPKLRKNFLHFLDEMAQEMASTAKNLRNVFDRKLNESRTSGRDILFSKKPPVPILPRSLTAEPTLIDYDPLEIARQLTLIESGLYRAIKPWECLNLSWAKKDKEKRAPRIIAMINRFNQVSNWIGTIILQCSELRARVTLFKHIIEIAHHCLELNNFNAVMEIISGLHGSSVYRLKQTRAQIDSKHAKMLEDCEAVVSRDQNFKNFRSKLHSADPPAIPYLGVYLTDLTFIEEGNNDNDANGLINFVKRQQVFGVISEIQQYQHTPYCLEPVGFIEDWLLEREFITEEEGFKLSLEVEPRGYKAPDAPSKRRLALARQMSVSAKKGSSLKDVSVSLNRYSSPYGELECVKSYLFYDPDTPDNIIVSTDYEQQVIKGGTLTKLVERLTHEIFPGPNYMGAFLMTFRSFTTTSELLDMLINRFNMPKPKAPSKEQAKAFRTEQLIPIHFRVFNVLKDWLGMYGTDFRKDTVLVQRIMDFTNSVLGEHPSLSSAAKAVLDIIKATPRVAKEPTIIALGSTPSEQPISILDIDMDALCAELYAFTSATFCNVEPREYLNAQWKEKEGRFKCIHLHRLYNYHRSLCAWVKTELFSSPDVPTRALVLAQFIHMADKFSKLTDMNSCYSILITIENLRDEELQVTWEWLAPRYISVWSRLQQLRRKNTDTGKPKSTASSTPSKRTRTFTSVNTPPPPIPYLIPILSKLEILNAEPDFYENREEIINFDKRYKTYLACSDYLALSDAYLIPESSVDDNLISYIQGVRILGDDELHVVLENMNDRRPDGITPSERQRREMIDTVEGSIDESIKPLLLQLIHKDEAFRAFVMNHLAERIQGDTVRHIKQEMEKFAKLGKLMLSLEMVRKKRRKQQEMEILSEMASLYFPQGNAHIWTKMDSESSVYGWEEEISLVTVENDGGDSFVLDARYYAKKTDIATIVRLVQFYHDQSGDEDTETALCFLLVLGIDDDAAEIARNNTINVIKI